MKAASMNGICTHLEIQATLEDFSGFVYSKENLCREELEIEQKNSDAIFYAVTGLADNDVVNRWGQSFQLEWSVLLLLFMCAFFVALPSQGAYQTGLSPAHDAAAKFTDRA